jgi:hypothetical protein
MPSKASLLPPDVLPQIRFPGAYRCVCVELRITHLAVNAILEVGGGRMGGWVMHPLAVNPAAATNCMGPRFDAV